MKFFQTKILLKNTVHNDLECYNKSNYGGTHIKSWPFYKFIKMWIDGNLENARSFWIDWLVDEYYKYRFDEKSKGGMYQGSVHKYTIKFINDDKTKYWLDPSLIDSKYIRKGAEILVNKRIEMVKSVIKKGYNMNLGAQIYAVKKGDIYVLKGGHHRAVIMYILGQESLPGVIVCSKILWEFKTWLVRIKKFLR